MKYRQRQLGGALDLAAEPAVGVVEDQERPSPGATSAGRLSSRPSLRGSDWGTLHVWPGERGDVFDPDAAGDHHGVVAPDHLLAMPEGQPDPARAVEASRGKLFMIASGSAGLGDRVGRDEHAVAVDAADPDGARR